jgi:hypothetical protein
MVSREVRRKEIRAIPTLEEIGEIEEDFIETKSVGSIGDGIDGDISSEDGEDGLLRWEDCRIPDAVLGPDNAELHEVPPFTVDNFGGNLEELGDIDGLDLKGMFYKFWTVPMCMQMIEATNAYGNAYVRGWKDMDTREFEAFIGIILYLGCCSYPSRKEIWRPGIKGCALVKQIMTIGRFEQLCRAWHCKDQTVYSAAELKIFKAADPFWAVKDFVTELSRNYENMWTPGQLFDIDEQTIPWKGRHKCRTYNPNKPEKWHFKVLSLNCSITGYQCAFYLYQGKSEQRPPTISATAYPSYVLLQNAKYHNKGYILFTDNWFTSLQQLQICQQRGIEMVGTIKKGRTGLPPEFKGSKNVLRVRGQHITKKAILSGQKEVWFTCWLDKKQVFLLHTIPTFVGSCNREVQRGGTWQAVQYQRPTIIQLYNQGMGGTDAGDQRMQSYRSSLKTRSWIPRVLSHCLNSTVVNLFIFASKTVGQTPNFPKTHLNFRDMLIDQFFEPTQKALILDHSARHQKTQSKTAWNNDIFRRTGQHFAHIFKKPPESRFEGNYKRKGTSTNTRNFHRGNCMMCNRTTSTKCIQCRIYLCIIGDQDEKSCFTSFHSNADLYDNNSIQVEICSSSDEE